MQKAIDVDFPKTWIPANDMVVEEEPIQALIRTMTEFSNDQIDTLEDELDFYAFTGITGSLMKEVFHSVPTAGVNIKPLASPISNRGVVEQNNELRRCAS